MQSVPPRSKQRSRGDGAARRFVTDESLVLRNYDGDRSHEVTVRFLDADDEVAFARTYELGPGETLSTHTRLPRAVYEVVARLDGDTVRTTECLVGSGPDETAVVETGNGSLSVVEGVI